MGLPIIQSQLVNLIQAFYEHLLCKDYRDINSVFKEQLGFSFSHEPPAYVKPMVTVPF